MEQQRNLVRQEQWIISLTLWIFAYNGLTQEAEAYAKSRSILWSSLPESNELMEHVGLHHLPKLSEKDTVA